ncbi:MAG: hypothetical protein HYY22_09345 [Thaumarchaeota archaeon]|nr:hypothetical protein [Nitrososphaerota archaeon]
MKILSHRQQLLADHSSTSYMFYSPKPLNKEARAIVSKMSSHVDVSAHTAEITYHGDSADLGEARREKFLEHYEVEVRESYDWWDISIMLEEARLPDVEAVTQNEETDSEATLTFDRIGDRLRLRLEGCHLDYDACHSEFGEDLMRMLAEFAIDIRDELYAGKIDALKVMITYCRENKVLKSRGLSPAAKTLSTILESI